MPGKQPVLRLARLGLPYPEIGRRLGIPVGLAYLIATGRAADGSDGTPARSTGAPAPASTQTLVNPPAVNPTEREDVLAWVHERARRDNGGRPPVVAGREEGSR